jgi:hypothetical protein
MTVRTMTPEAIMVYPDLFEPTSFKDGPEYYRCLLLLKGTQICLMSSGV